MKIDYDKLESFLGDTVALNNTKTSDECIVDTISAFNVNIKDEIWFYGQRTGDWYNEVIELNDTVTSFIKGEE